MIFLHYTSLAVLLEQPFAYPQRLAKPLRGKVQDYRLQQLQRIQPDIQIIQTTQGKPIAAHGDLHFNHSHSQNYYALAYSSDVIDLGIDIEDFSRQVRMQQLAKSVFHPDEYRTWQSLDYCRQFWFKVWTIKEAVLKAHGLGIRLNLKSLNTHAHATWDFGLLEHAQLGQFIYQCIPLPHSMLSIAYRANAQPVLCPIKIDLR